MPAHFERYTKISLSAQQKMHAYIHIHAYMYIHIVYYATGYFMKTSLIKCMFSCVRIEQTYAHNETFSIQHFFAHIVHTLTTAVQAVDTHSHTHSNPHLHTHMHIQIFGGSVAAVAVVVQVVVVGILYYTKRAFLHSTRVTCVYGCVFLCISVYKRVPSTSYPIQLAATTAAAAADAAAAAAASRVSHSPLRCCLRTRVCCAHIHFVKCDVSVLCA